MMPWRVFLARSVAAGAIVGVFVAAAAFVGVRLAGADPGGPPTRNALTFAGVLRNADGSVTTRATMLSFVFHRSGLPDCAAPAVSVVPNASGAFSALVPIDACGSTFFNGADVSYDVFIAGEDAAIASNVAVTPVPYARFADQVGVSSDCPAGYLVDGLHPHVICQRRTNPSEPTTAYDEVVKVGTGASAFWIDRYEATIWTTPTGTGTPLGTVSADYPAGFPPNGQWVRPPSGAPPAQPYALSRPGDWFPSRFLTWFQAQAACRNVGKRLPSGEEWLAAAAGSDDFGFTSDGADGRCVTNTAVRTLHARSRCLSVYGAQDMIGNVSEWTADWFANTSAGMARTAPASNWGMTFGSDITVNVASFVDRGDAIVGSVPAAALRGGSYNMGAGAGIFAFDLNNAPTFSEALVGFRCVIPR